MNDAWIEAALARAWAEGWQHYSDHFHPADPEFGRNPYGRGSNDHNAESDRTDAPDDDLAEIRAEYQRLHSWIDWT